MDAVMIDAMIVEAIRAERERIKKRLEDALVRMPWLSEETRRAIKRCVGEG
jgi:hypothetical protein